MPMRICAISLLHAAFLSTTTSLFLGVSPQQGLAAGTGPGGVDVLHVPMAWCPVIGSPAQANPNIGADATTDAILWRRHERPTDNIFINTAGITFRSAINNAWGTFNFPQITDPDTALATVGDMRGEDVNANGVEFNAMIDACDLAYTNVGRANIGVTAVNAGLFHDAAGAYVGIIGWGGCTRPAGSNNSTCSTPYDGRIAVIDNAYLHPGSPDRTFPGSNLQFTLTDPLDVLTGHELGHALGLGHVNNTNNLMNAGTADNDGDGQIDNIGLSAAQITTLRASSNVVPGLEVDPPLQIDPGDFIADRVMDLKDDRDFDPIADISSVRASFDKRNNRVYFSVKLKGARTEKNQRVPGTLWLAVDAREEVGGLGKELAKVAGLDVPTLEDAELLIRVDIRYPRADVTAWVATPSGIADFANIFAEYRTLIMHPWYLPIEGQETRPAKDGPLYDTIAVSLPAKIAGIQLDKAFAIDAILATEEMEALDRIVGEPEDRILVLEDPDFPHCFALDKGNPGDVVPVLVEGLLPRAPIHALIGPDEVAKGETDDRGGTKIDLPIPDEIRGGLHLVTIGVDDTALTADCVVQVGDRLDGDPKQIRPDFELDKRRLELLERHIRLLEQSTELMRHLMFER